MNYTIVLKEYSPRVKGEIKKLLTDSGYHFYTLGNGSFTGFDVFDAKLKDLESSLIKYLDKITFHKF